MDIGYKNSLEQYFNGVNSTSIENMESKFVEMIDDKLFLKSEDKNNLIKEYFESLVSAVNTIEGYSYLDNETKGLVIRNDDDTNSVYPINENINDHRTAIKSIVYERFINSDDAAKINKDFIDNLKDGLTEKLSNDPTVINQIRENKPYGNGLVTEEKWQGMAIQAMVDNIANVMNKGGTLSTEAIYEKAGEQFSHSEFSTQFLMKVHAEELEGFKSMSKHDQMQVYEKIYTEERNKIIKQDQQFLKENPIQNDIKNTETLRVEEMEVRNNPNSTNEEKEAAKQDRKNGEWNDFKQTDLYKIQSMSDDMQMDKSFKNEAYEAFKPHEGLTSQKEWQTILSEEIATNKVNSDNGKEPLLSRQEIYTKANEIMANYENDRIDYLKEIAIDNPQKLSAMINDERSAAKDMDIKFNDPTKDIQYSSQAERSQANTVKEGTIFSTTNALYDATIAARSFDELKQRHDASYGGDFKNTVKVITPDNKEFNFNTIKDRTSENMGQYIDNQSATDIVKLKNANAPAEEIKATESKGMELARSFGLPKFEVEAIKQEANSVNKAPQNVADKILTPQEQEKISAAKEVVKQELLNKIKGIKPQQSSTKIKM